MNYFFALIENPIAMVQCGFEIPHLHELVNRNLAFMPERRVHTDHRTSQVVSELTELLYCSPSRIPIIDRTPENSRNLTLGFE